jgi:hypothetical protein
MQDRPTVAEFLTAIEQLLDTELVPHLTGSRQFYARVATNALRMVMRELDQEEDHLVTEWAGLNTLLPQAAAPTTRVALRAAIHQRTEELCERIRQGEADTGPYREQVLTHVRQTVENKLRVSNPGWIESPAIRNPQSAIRNRSV